MEVDVQGHRLKLSNLDKVMYPATGFTKGHVIDYYTPIAPAMLGHLHNRPLTRIRYPNGVDDKFMKQVLPPLEFTSWFGRFLPALGPLSEPPRVNDHADAKQSHLDGLCLSRAWCFKLLGFEDFATSHLRAGLPHVVGGDYAGEHWLASFAALALTAEAPKSP